MVTLHYNFYWIRTKITVIRYCSKATVIFDLPVPYKTGFLMISVNFQHREENIKVFLRGRTNSSQRLATSLKGRQGSEELEKVGQLFQAVIHFHPNHLQPNIINTSFCAVVLNQCFNNLKTIKTNEAVYMTLRTKSLITQTKNFLLKHWTVLTNCCLGCIDPGT